MSMLPFIGYCFNCRHDHGDGSLLGSGPYIFSTDKDQEIAALRQQLEEAQARNDFIDEAAARVPMDTLLIARVELAEAECSARDVVIAELEQRLADAEGQEAAEYQWKKPEYVHWFSCSKEHHLACLKDHRLLTRALYLHPAPPATDGLEPVTGDILPKVGSRVLIHLGRQDEWVEHAVTGYYVWGDLGGNESLHRVFVRVVDDAGFPNARLLNDVRPVCAALAASKADGKGGDAS